MGFKLMNGDYYPAMDEVIPKMEPGLYLIKDNYQRQCCIATRLADKFDLPEKLYGHCEAFVDRVVRAIEHTRGNVGMLFHGYQGTGKTVMGKVICNTLNRPVILIQKPVSLQWFTEFISCYEQEFVIFVDEYEKVFYRSPNELLSVLDGVFSCKSKFTFIATANQPKVSPYMYNRPSRIKYVREFTFLTPETVAEIVVDKLKKKHLIQTVIDYLGTKNQLTVDTVTTFISEVDIQNLSVAECGEYFNFAEGKNALAPLEEEELDDVADNYND